MTNPNPTVGNNGTSMKPPNKVEITITALNYAVNIYSRQPVRFIDKFAQDDKRIEECFYHKVKDGRFFE
jgi:hypothetical protein